MVIKHARWKNLVPESPLGNSKRKRTYAQVAWWFSPFRRIVASTKCVHVVMYMSVPAEHKIPSNSALVLLSATSQARNFRQQRASKLFSPLSTLVAHGRLSLAQPLGPPNDDLCHWFVSEPGRLLRLQASPYILGTDTVGASTGSAGFPSRFQEQCKLVQPQIQV